MSYSLSDGYVQCNLAYGSSQIGSGIHGSKPCQGNLFLFSLTYTVFFSFFSTLYHSNFFQVVIGSVDLAANHDVLQIIEVCSVFPLQIISPPFNNMSLFCLQMQVLDDRARDQRLVALLEKYHKSQK